MYLCSYFGLNCLQCCREHKKPPDKLKEGSRILTHPSCAHGGMQASPAPATYFMLCDAHGSQTARCSLGSCELGIERERESWCCAGALYLSRSKKEVISEGVGVDNGAKRRRPIGVSVDNTHIH